MPSDPGSTGRDKRQGLLACRWRKPQRFSPGRPENAPWTVGRRARRQVGTEGQGKEFGTFFLLTLWGGASGISWISCVCQTGVLGLHFHQEAHAGSSV